MSENSNIEWTDHTFNPWIGCTQVSPGCLHCYAETRDRRHLLENVDHWGPGAPRYRTGASTWKQPLRWQRVSYAGRFRQCPGCGWRGDVTADDMDCPTEGCSSAAIDMEVARPRVFCASLADWLDDDGVPIEWLADLLRLIHDTPDLDWLLLTKRPQNWAVRIEGVLKWIEATSEWETATARTSTPLIRLRDWLADWFVLRKPPANVWIGTTVEDQTRANERIPRLLEIPARVRFLSCEPLLRAVDLTRVIYHDESERCQWDALTGTHIVLDSDSMDAVALFEDHGRKIDWVIAGGESGPEARPMHPDWGRALRDQCAAAGVPFFFKQWGEFKPLGVDKDWRSCEGILTTKHLGKDGFNWLRVGKKAAGRLLDKVEHSAWPVVTDGKRQDAASTTEGANL